METPAVFRYSNQQGRYNARFTAQRQMFDWNDELMTTDSVTFRIYRDHDDPTCWWNLIFANGVLFFKSSECSSFKMAKMYASRLAEVGRLQEWAMALMLDFNAMRGDTPESVARFTQHEAFMLTLDDFYGA